VRFTTLSRQAIRRYVESGEALDKAGAYGIQGKAAAFVESMTGTYTGVVGLPAFETLSLLSRLGIPLP
jgi:septum formation protein